MGRGANKLTALFVGRAVKKGEKALHADGSGLYLQVTGPEAASWLLRYMLDGRARAMGLGPVADASLADARTRAADARKLLLDGIDPIEARKGERAQAQLEAARTITFKECAEKFIAAHRPGW